MESLKELYAAGASRRRVARVGQASWHEVGEQLARAFGSRACDGFPEFTNHVRTLLRRSSLDLAMTVDCVHLYPAPRLGNASRHLHGGNRKKSFQALALQKII